MNPIEELFNELLLPIIKKETRIERPPTETLVYENGYDDMAHRIQLVQIQLQQPLFNFANLLSHITSLPALSEQSKTLLNSLCERINACKKHMSEANLDQPVSEVVFSNTFAYLYYISELLPIFANNRFPFSYRLVGTSDTPLAQHTSFVFEYLMTLWGFVSHLYRHLDLGGTRCIQEAEVFTKYITSLDLCIHSLREMVTYIDRIKNNQVPYKRFVYRASPTSISNKSISSSTKPVETPIDLEELQHEKDIALIQTYFGGSRGINARLHLFYAKKYELSFARALIKAKIEDILGDEDGASFVTKENLGNIIALAGVALQISQHYGTSNRKIKDDQCSLYHYTFHRTLYWQCVANFLRASVDFYQYTQREDRIEYGKQALKRAETIKTGLDSFNYTYRETPRLIKMMSHITTRMNGFFEIVNYKVKTLNHRSSDGVVLAPIEETLGDESKAPSIFQEQMNIQHQALCEKDESQIVKHSLSVLFKMKRLYFDGSSLPLNAITPDTSITITPTPVDNIDDKLNMAVLYERYNWFDYFNKKVGIDTNGDKVLVMSTDDIDMISNGYEEVKRMVQENLLRDPENTASSSLSNMLSSHLYL